MPEIGLFPLGLVLLPTERIPLHIFEPRYKELIGECLDEGREFGLVFGDTEGIREIGTRAAVIEVVDRFEDGRLNIVVEGRERFRLRELTEGRSFRTGEVEPVADEPSEADQAERERALALYRRVAEIVEAETAELDPASPLLSFEIASLVDFGAERKQSLLELRSEPERLRVVCELLENAAESILLERELGERASRNGTRPSR